MRLALFDKDKQGSHDDCNHQHDQSNQENPANGLFAYVSSHLASGQVYLTPLKMQDFRLATGVPAYVDFKSIPYQDSDVLEWYRRLQLVYAFYNGGLDPCAALHNFAVTEGLTRAVVPAVDPETACPSLAVLYEDPAYLIYELK